MTEERSQYRYPVVVGTFVALGLLILLLAIFTLGGQRGSFLNTRHLQARFADIGGLKKGDNVWLAGVKVGMIRRIEITGRRNVMVTLSVDESVDSLIRKDSRVRISSDGIMGNRIVVIYGGTPREPMLQEDEILEADAYNDPQDLLRTLGEGSRDAAELASNLKDISSEILNGNGVIGRLIQDSIWSSTLVETSTGLQRTISRLETTADRTQTFMENLNRSAEQMHQPGNLMYELLEDTTFYHDLLESSRRLKAGLTSLSAFSTSMERSGEALNRKTGIAGTLLYDSTAARHLNRTLHHLDSASRILEIDLRALQHSIFLRRYFRKEERRKK